MDVYYTMETPHNYFPALVSGDNLHTIASWCQLTELGKAVEINATYSAISPYPISGKQIIIHSSLCSKANKNSHIYTKIHK